MNPTEKHDGAQHVLYDAEQLSDVGPMVFDPVALEQAGLVRGSAEGRGTTHFVELEGKACALRHYRRGGMVAGLLGDRYLRGSLSKSRAWREWHLLKDLAARGLPVPKPIAARVVTHGLFYRADLITQRLMGVRPLSRILKDGPLLPAAQWREIGRCIRRFHDEGVYHADLNAHNILLSPDDSVWIIDFDRGCIRKPALGWQQANLDRLRRSLDKISELNESSHSHESDWQQLTEGWAG